MAKKVNSNTQKKTQMTSTTPPKETLIQKAQSIILPPAPPSNEITGIDNTATAIPKPAVMQEREKSAEAADITKRKQLIKELLDYQAESQRLWLTNLSLEDKQHRTTVETEMMSYLANLAIEKVPLIPKIDKSKFPDRTREVHQLIDAGKWYEAKELYMRSKVNHYNFSAPPQQFGSPVTPTPATIIYKAVQSGDLEWILEMIADGADIDMPITNQACAMSARDWIRVRGRKDDDKGDVDGLQPLIGESPGRAKMWNNIALWDAFCSSTKKIY